MGTLSPRCGERRPATSSHAARWMSSCLRPRAARQPSWAAGRPGGREARAAGAAERNVVMSDAGWIYGAAHVRLAFLRGPRLGTKTSPGPGTARLGLNKSPLITGRPRPGPRPAEEQRRCCFLCQRRLRWGPALCPGGRPRPASPWLYGLVEGAEPHPPRFSSSVKWDNGPYEAIVGHSRMSKS